MLSRPMLSRLVAPLTLCLLLAVPALAEVSARFFPAAFAELDEASRRAVQAELQRVGLYDGTVDGSYGPGTEKALVRAVERLQQDSFEVTILLDTEADAVSFLFVLAEGGYAQWLSRSGG